MAVLRQCQPLWSCLQDCEWRSDAEKEKKSGRKGRVRKIQPLHHHFWAAVRRHTCSIQRLLDTHPTSSPAQLAFWRNIAFYSFVFCFFFLCICCWFCSMWLNYKKRRTQCVCSSNSFSSSFSFPFLSSSIFFFYFFFFKWILCPVGTQGRVLMNLNERLNLFSMFYLFFRVWGVNWIDGSDACSSQEQYRDLLFWLSSCYGAVHYWFHFSSLFLLLTFAFALYLFLLSRPASLSSWLLLFSCLHCQLSIKKAASC